MEGFLNKRQFVASTAIRASDRPVHSWSLTSVHYYSSFDS